MKFIIDAQLPPALAGWLHESGQEAAHVDEIGLCDATDGQIWEHALRTEAGPPDRGSNLKEPN